MDDAQYPALERALEYSHKKLANFEMLQGLSTLAIAEAIHRLAAATEASNGA